MANNQQGCEQNNWTKNTPLEVNHHSNNGPSTWMMINPYACHQPSKDWWHGRLPAVWSYMKMYVHLSLKLSHTHLPLIYLCGFHLSKYIYIYLQPHHWSVELFKRVIKSVVEGLPHSNCGPIPGLTCCDLDAWQTVAQKWANVKSSLLKLGPQSATRRSFGCQMTIQHQSTIQGCFRHAAKGVVAQFHSILLEKSSAAEIKKAMAPNCSVALNWLFVHPPLFRASVWTER